MDNYATMISISMTYVRLWKDWTLKFQKNLNLFKNKEKVFAVMKILKIIFNQIGSQKINYYLALPLNGEVEVNFLSKKEIYLNVDKYNF